MIAVDGVSRAFGGHPAVDGVTFDVQAGEVVGLLGPNGAGKTTTIRLALGLLRPHAGRVEVTRPLGYLPEHLQPYDGLTVRAYLRFSCRTRRLDASIDDALRDAGVEDLARRPIGRLSKGQRQRVALAQAVLGAPATLVLDEPTASLDPKQVVDVRSLVRRRADAGAAVLLSTHLLAEAAAVCDRVVVLSAGRVVAIEAPGPDLEQRFLSLTA
ncbi:MAG TPA: ABC transporter ATP-binding protein [Acidimicrobiales bacterium]|nr:ABC transporter ATP-binding protein [Acidimicrobiales bacterium]